MFTHFIGFRSEFVRIDTPSHAMLAGVMNGLTFAP
jgi:hypothetical protein